MAALGVTAELVGLLGLKVNLQWPRPKRVCLHGRRRRRTHSMRAAVDPQSCTEEEDRAMTTEAFHQFSSLSKGSWNGSFCQYDVLGNALQRVNTNLAVTSYGEDELVSLMQTLKIKQAPPKTSISGGHTDSEWEEYKLRETNMFTIDNHEQIGFFPEGMAFSLRHQSADVVDKVLRVGVLGEDDVDEEFPKKSSNWSALSVRFKLGSGRVQLYAAGTIRFELGLNPSEPAVESSSPVRTCCELGPADGWEVIFLQNFNVFSSPQL